MRRPTHQFRPGIPEQFETRVVPTLTAYPGVVPFIPQGQFDPNALASGYDYPDKGTASAEYFAVDHDTISITVTNNTGASHYLTFVVYSAPGSGPGGQIDNLASQTLVHSETQPVGSALGSTASFSVDVSTLKLTGQQKLQCDVFWTDDPNGLAPKKVKLDDLTGHLVVGELFDFDPDTGKKDHK